jgi:hypothetical protein
MDEHIPASIPHDDDLERVLIESMKGAGGQMDVDDLQLQRALEESRK